MDSGFEAYDAAYGVGPASKSPLFGHIINTLLTKLVRSRWLHIGLVLF